MARSRYATWFATGVKSGRLGAPDKSVRENGKNIRCLHEVNENVLFGRKIKILLKAELIFSSSAPAESAKCWVRC